MYTMRVRETGRGGHRLCAKVVDERFIYKIECIERRESRWRLVTLVRMRVAVWLPGL